MANLAIRQSKLMADLAIRPSASMLGWIVAMLGWIAKSNQSKSNRYACQISRTSSIGMMQGSLVA